MGHDPAAESLRVVSRDLEDYDYDPGERQHEHVEELPRASLSSKAGGNETSSK
jgi:hypothetical protein